MHRRHLILGILISGALLPFVPPWVLARPANQAGQIRKTDARWRELLTPEQFRILFRDGTERAFSSPLNDEKRPGTYVCAACFLPLFSAEAKYDSGTGWPSFYQPIDMAHIGTRRDFSLFVPRKEYHCARCGGHQGHVFSDGPQPTGERWCNNGLALRFIPEGETMPEPRGQT